MERKGFSTGKSLGKFTHFYMAHCVHYGSFHGGRASLGGKMMNSVFDMLRSGISKGIF